MRLRPAFPWLWVFMLVTGVWFVVDAGDAAAATTERVSVTSGGEEGNEASGVPSISADGRYVAFYSWASNLVSGDTNGASDVFVHDRVTGTTERVSVSSSGEQGDHNASLPPSISADGRFVAFSSDASNLVPGDTNGYGDIFVHDRVTGTTERVSVSSAGEEGIGYSERPSFSADGRYVVFNSWASNLLSGDTNGASDVFVHDRVTGTTERVSLSSAGEQGNRFSNDPSISADGRYVAFVSYATNLVPGDTNNTEDDFVHDRVTGTTERVSLSSTGEEANARSFFSSISADGRFVAFSSDASNLAPGDTNGSWDAFVHDRVTGTTERVSVSSTGEQGNSASYLYSISADGRYVVFYSRATNLVPGDTNGYPDTFVYDRGTGATERVSVSSPGEEANSSSVSASISAEGRYVAFASEASNLVASDTNGHEDVFVRDRGHAGSPPTVSYTDSESATSALASFTCGPGAAATWRRALTGMPFAHSGIYVMSSEVMGHGITGMRFALPTGPTAPAEVALGVWAYVSDRTDGDSSTFLGFQFAEDYPTAAPGWGQMLGWEALSDTASRYQLAGSTQPVEVGLPAGAWHLVHLRYVRATNDLTLWLDGQEKGTVNAPGAAGQTPCYVVLGALGEADTATQHVYFDDVQVTLVGYSGPPTVDRPFALLEGQEQVAEDHTVSYTLQYGNGYPMLGTEEVTETLPQTMYVGLSLPAGYSLVSADPLPDRVGEGTAVWALDLPAMQQAGYIYLNLNTPTGLAEVTEDRMWAWATTDSGAATTDPPSPPNWTNPTDPIWGAPQDVLPQLIELEPKSDVWVRKRGPRSASPGDTVVYSLTVGNSGFAPAEEVVVRDLMPEVLGGGDRIVANLGDLEVGETWTGVLSGALPWEVPGDTLLLNTAHVPTGPAELPTDNNTSQWQTTVQAARDPNAISVSPTGGVERGERLTYTLECENTGLGTAYGVYATATLDKQLNGATLLVSDPDAVSYDPTSRTLVWDVGTLDPGEGASAWFTVSVASDARRARPIIEQAVVYFPSVPETTPTNIVNGSFSDVAWDHWAVLPIEQTYENGVVRGYDDGTYRPAEVVDRAQMAVYVARALTGGDEYVPTGPAVPTFSDVDTDHWAYRYIEYAYDQQVVVGYGGGIYQPAWSVDRGQMAVYMARALVAPAGDAGVPEPPPSPSFSDVTPTGASAWCYPHVEYVVDEGVVGGYEDGTYRPEYTVTREQMAVYVARAFRLPM